LPAHGNEADSSIFSRQILERGGEGGRERRKMSGKRQRESKKQEGRKAEIYLLIHI
jgi:hypothetical protein